MNEKMLLTIARLAAPELETLRVRNRDALDFAEVSVMGLKNALRAAYGLGKRDGENAGA